MSLSNSRQGKRKSGIRDAIMGRRKRKGLPFCSREEEMARLQVEEIVGLEPIKLPHEVARDAKRLARFLENLEGTINKLIIGVKQH